MPAKAKKFLITTETHEIFIVRRNGRNAVKGNCGECGQEVELVSIDTAVTLTGIGAIELFRSLERGLTHFVESTEGHVLICEPSLRYMQRSKSAACPQLLNSSETGDVEPGISDFGEN